MKVNNPNHNASTLAVGRFAPSPTGDLHMGSLMAAVASYLSARCCGGRWLVRIEDVDTPRQMRGAAERILRDLERFGMEWDGPVLYQSQRHEHYRAKLDDLIKSGYVYPCKCSRREIQSAGLLGIEGYRYSGCCRNATHSDTRTSAWRVCVSNENIFFTDGIQGEISQCLADDVGDFVLLRADGCWAYQLAVVVDDAEQGINQVVRGADLLDSTPRQIWLQRLLGYVQPQYFHIPVLANAAGEKLSKQTLAPALLSGQESQQLYQALHFLWQCPPQALLTENIQEIWRWALSNWCVSGIPQKRFFSCN